MDDEFRRRKDCFGSSDDDTFSRSKIHSSEKKFPAKRSASTWRSQNCSSLDLNFSDTVDLQEFAHAGEDDLDSPYFLLEADRSDRPSTREPSPEPLGRKAEEYFAVATPWHSGQFSGAPSVEPQRWKETKMPTNKNSLQ